MNIETIIISLSYFGIFLLMIANGIFSFPSSQILYIICGYFIFKGDLQIIPTVLAGSFGNTVGNIILFEATKWKGLEYVLKFNLLPKKEIQKITIAFQHKGAWFLFFGKLLPSIKVFIPIIAGMGKISRISYTILILISSTIWTVPFLSIGYYFGKSSDVFSKYAIFLIIIAIFVMFAFYKYINNEKILKEMKKMKNEV